MGSLKIIKPGMLTTVQSRNEKGSAFFAIPQSGPMDSSSAMAANLLVDNPTEVPVIECTGIAPTIQFSSDATISIQGASCNWTLDGEVISTDSPIFVKSNSILEGKLFRNGFRAYIAIQGLIDRSSYLRNFVAIPLQKNDLITWTDAISEVPHLTLKRKEINKDTIPIYKGPEYDYLEDQSKIKLVSDIFKISRDTNRMGSKIEGPLINCHTKQLESSKSIFPGVIQSTPSGKLIVILQDGQRTGGYPRIAYVPKVELDYFNQLSIGKTFAFNMVP